MICCAESTPRPGHFGQALHRSVMESEQPCHLLIELGEVVFDQAQFTGRRPCACLSQWHRRLDCSMVNFDLAAPDTTFCPIPTIFISFRGPRGPALPSCESRPAR